MKIAIIPVIVSFLANFTLAQNVELKEARFRLGDNAAWKETSFDDSAWKKIKSNTGWQDFVPYNGVGWFRFHFILPSSLKQKAAAKEKLRVFLSRVDDDDETYWNSVKIGSSSGSHIIREYFVNSDGSFLMWDQENVLAVRVEDFHGFGGIFGGTPYINMTGLLDSLKVKIETHSGDCLLAVSNGANRAIDGDLSAAVFSPEKKETIKHYKQSYNLSAGQKLSIPVAKESEARNRVDIVLRERQTGRTVKHSMILPYLLTPKESKKPRLNGAKIFGVRPGSPVLFRIAASGEAPMTFSVANLPKGLKLDARKGIITGVLKEAGEYKMTVKASNSQGSASRKFSILAGNGIALTPPMGWNSWNCWAPSVSEDKVRAGARAMTDKGLVNHGWSYINIDDGWQAESRDNHGNMKTNQKFKDMKALGDWLHGEGLKFGMYSSPGESTCVGFLGSLGHEEQDANLYASWGVDYLKYDWCGYSKTAGNKTDLATYQKPYLIMRDALRKQNRDIVYSLCQYGMGNVWEWGEQVDANCWRTTGDVEDTWEYISGIALSQTVQYKHAKPGRWNDPDMLTIGKVGWGRDLRPSGLTYDEQYTHISLWCLLNAPLLLGCDLSQLDPFTFNLIANDEVLEVNQDVLGIQAAPIIQTPVRQVWMKKIERGHAIGIFNMSEEDAALTINWSELGMSNSKYSVRDLWRQKELGHFDKSFSAFVPSHGVVLIKVSE
ncbi:MAG: alpha-galactosidase [Candidatus Nephrothrix sp. EaCA]|nr:MAG: alpha-galactosidase [Candidatus Nephrothrix sp. EaCA]